MAPRGRGPAGLRVRLRPFRATDLPRVVAWRRDSEVQRGALWADAPFGRRAAQRWLRAVTGGLDHTRLTFAIELLGSGRLIGLTNLARIDRRLGTAYFGVVIGEKDSWGQGFGREALALMLRHAVGLGLHKVLLEVASDNARAIALYRRAGFETEGVLRRQQRRADGFVDVMIMAVFLDGAAETRRASAPRAGASTGARKDPTWLS